MEGLCALPGIGRSTAGAIISIAFGRRAVILDGNVKRVLARYRAIPVGRASRSARAAVAGRGPYTPAGRCGEYSQAMMDLGATLCAGKSPPASAARWPRIVRPWRRENHNHSRAANRARPCR